MATLSFLGHACFTLQANNCSIIFDPFLSDNPHKIAQPGDISCNYIFVSHGHFDHLGDAVEIAKQNNATIISTAEIAKHCAELGASTHAMHLGGKHSFNFGYVRVTPAFHGSGIAGGHACGFVINFFDRTIYFAGDTSIFGDMELIGKLENIDYALLPIGDNFTMGIDDATYAVNLLKPKHVIPMHYNTWPLIAQNPADFKRKVESSYNVPVAIIKPGESISV